MAREQAGCMRGILLGIRFLPVVPFQVEQVAAVVQKRVAHISHFVPECVTSTSSGLVR